MAWEALNNIAIARSSRLVIVVNDNERSYTPTIGGLATALTSLRTNPRYEQVLDLVKKRLNSVPGVGHAAYDALLTSAAAERDLARRAELLCDAESIALRELPWIPLMHYRSKALIAPRLHGYVPNLRNAAPTRFMRLDA